MIDARIKNIERYLGLQVGEGQYDSRLDAIERYLKVSTGGGSIIARIDGIENIIALPVYIITQPPENSYYSAGDLVELTVIAIGNNLSYNWQYVNSQNVWADMSEPSSKTNYLHFTYQTKWNGRKYRCVITGSGTSVISDTATIRTKT